MLLKGSGKRVKKQTEIRILLVLLVLVISSLACNRPTAIQATQPPTAEPMSEEDMNRLQDEMAATLATSGSVTITITQEQINSIIAAQIAQQPEQIFIEPSIVLIDGKMQVSGKIKQAGLTLDMEMVLIPDLNANGEPTLEIKEMKLSGIPVPDELKEQASNLINQALQEYLVNQTSNFEITDFQIEDGKMTITGNTD